jgi:hypothetical protein
MEGVQWMRDAFRLFLRRPLPFTAMFVAFLLVALLATLVPVAGGVVMLMSLPLLSLGFMLGSRAAQNDLPVNPGQFIEPLRGERSRRNTLLSLCAAYALGTCTDHDAQRMGRRRRLRPAAGADGQGRRRPCGNGGAARRPAPDLGPGHPLRPGRLPVGALLARAGAGALAGPERWPGAVLQHAGDVALQGRVPDVLAGLGGGDRDLRRDRGPALQPVRCPPAGRRHRHAGR